MIANLLFLFAASFWSPRYVVGGVIALVILLYLLYSLIRPEKF